LLPLKLLPLKLLPLKSLPRKLLPLKLLPLKLLPLKSLPLKLLPLKSLPRKFALAAVAFSSSWRVVMQNSPSHSKSTAAVYRCLIWCSNLVLLLFGWGLSR
jgi:hypothetical protein